MKRFRLVVVALVTLFLAGPAVAQSARATGVVRDLNGRALKGATVRAVNEEAVPPQITSTTDDKGRWAMIGLRTGTWTFIVEAPGFASLRADAPVRVAASAPLVFALARDPGPIPGALDRNVLQLVIAANGMRDSGQYEQALAAYQQIRDQNPKLSSINLVVAGVYRKQAAAGTDQAARRALLDRALDTYNQLLNDETTGDRARAEIASTRAEIQALSR